ncbi:MAG: S41 family peptidase [Chitinispirillaceae bacterium]
MEKTSNQPARKFFGRTPFVGMVVLIVVITGLVMDSTRADGDNFYADISRLDNVVKNVHQNYVDELDSKELVNSAIKGMMKKLDPHTAYLEEKASEELRIQTDGKFGGLGIQISIRDKVLTVMTPISGTPASRAGIQSGDQIIEIEGESTKGITVDKAVNKLRGEPGSKVRILVRRKGVPKDIEYEITREIIRINSVPFYGVLDNDIGYITLTQFSQDAGAEVEKAIKELLDRGIKGLVFDLRLNPGGLLPQAIEVSEKFLPRKSLVVSTRGRVRGQNKDFFSRSNPVLPKDIPLAVLVDYASASASEIVAGAVQDWDRGVIVGDTSFGKGSVQSILRLDATHNLKLTTALYYTPAGRCINRTENFTGDSEDEETENAEEEAQKGETEADTSTYRTNNGRLVYGGGGIIPDTVVKQKIPDMAIRALYGKDVFFQFANLEYVKLQKRNVKIGKDYQIDDATMKDFYDYLDSIDFSYQSVAQVKFEEFKKKSGLMEDTAETEEKNPLMEPPKLNDSEMEQLKAAAGNIDSILEEESRRALKKNDAEIRRLVRNALLVREYGQDHEIMYRSKIKDDEQLKAAMELLSDKEIYSSFLKPGRNGIEEKEAKK